jgi:hypothetical protein
MVEPNSSGYSRCNLIAIYVKSQKNGKKRNKRLTRKAGCSKDVIVSQICSEKIKLSQNESPQSLYVMGKLINCSNSLKKGDAHVR